MEEYVWVSKLAHHTTLASRAHRVLLRMAEERQVRLTIAPAADADESACLAAVEDAVDRGVAGIMIVGWGDPRVLTAIENAVTAGIPVTAIDITFPREPEVFAGQAFDLLYDFHHAPDASRRPHGTSDVPGSSDPGFVLMTPDNIATFRALADVQERVEETLRETQSQYRSMLDALGDAVHMVDLDLRILQANAALVRWLGHLGLDPEIIGKSVPEAFPFVPPLVLEEYARVIESGEPLVTVEETSLGDQTVVSETLKIPILEDGQVVRVLTVIRDVTQAHGVQQRLAESQRRLAVLMDNLPGMAYRCANDADWTMEFVSSGCRSLTGYPPEDLVGNARLSYNDVIHPDDREMAHRSVQRALTSGDRFELTYRIVTAHGGEKWVWEQGTGVFDESRQLVGIEGFISDITARVLAEQEKDLLQERLGRARRMEEVGQLAGGIAHDFNNLLGGIMGYADLIKRKLLGQPELVAYAEAVVESAARASELTAQLLAFSRRARMHSVPVDVHRIVERIAVHLTRRVSPAIEVSLHLDAIDSVVQGDADQLSNVVLDIAENAVEAMPDGGSLTFRTFAIDLDKGACRRRALAIDPGRYLNLIIEDTGTGMSEAVLSHIFEPFFTTKSVGSGVGLGLSAAWGIVREHLGTIEVASEPGEGTVFGLYLPLSRRAVRQPSAEPAGTREVPPADHRRVLLVEDDPRVRQAVSAMLHTIGCHVTLASDGDEALDTYRRIWAEIDLIMLDLIMPGTPGPEVMRRIREINPLARVLLTSGYDITAGEIGEVSLLDTNFIRKPFGVDQLAVAVDAAMGHDTSPQ